MPELFQNASGDNTGIDPATSINYNLDAGTADNRCVLIGVAWQATGPGTEAWTSASVTYGGDTCTQIGTITIDDTKLSIFRKDGAKSGSNTVAVTLTGSGDLPNLASSAIAYSSAKQSGAASPVSATGTDVTSLSTSPSGFNKKISLNIVGNNSANNWDPDTGTERVSSGFARDDTSQNSEEGVEVNIASEADSWSGGTIHEAGIITVDIINDSSGGGASGIMNMVMT